MTQDREKCCVCLWSDKDDIMYGDWMTSKTIKAHYFCLLSSDSIPQRGKDHQGFLGFLHQDITASLSSFRDIECFLCGKSSAAVKCAHKDCDRYWHYPCGTRNACMTSFCDQFESFCNKHVPDPNGGMKHGSAFCQTCYELIPTYNHVDSIISSCCLHMPDWQKCFVHKKCIMSYTKNAGYDSICINCSMEEGGMNKNKWQNEMRQKGVFIPMVDAEWEREGYYKDHVKNKCEHPKCQTPFSSRNVWTCFVCGCFPRHLNCAKVQSFEDYYCPKCFDQSFVQRVPKW